MDSLTFDSVTKVYESSHLGRTLKSRGVEDLDLTVGDGEAFGLLGLNGSGKTTTFKLAMGLLEPTRGSVRVLGLPPSDPAAHEKIGFLPELPYFYSYLTPEEILTFYARLSKVPAGSLRSRVKKTLALVGLSKSARRRIGEFSKGMVQRVGLAQALVHEPKLLILDEPVSGLDPVAIKEFRDLLSRLNAEGTSMIISSHSISEVEKLCHRVGILQEGRLVRILTQDQWREKGLEALFVETVKEKE